MSRATRHQYAPQYLSPTMFDRAVKTPVGMEALIDILSYQRFAGSKGEQDMIDKYLLSIPGAKEDDYGNIWLWVGENPTTLFSSHTDTVEKRSAEGRKKVTIRQGWAHIGGDKGGVLGADCGTGVWIMLNLIHAKVPGLYIFHREEEIGGGGSSFVAKTHADLLDGIKRCIAFDRKATGHIITHQAGGRCCSDEFALGFAEQLNTVPEFAFAPNDGGTFTDSANYTHLIPECTNLSVGYYDQHTQDECQDLTFVSTLVNRLIALDWDALPTARDPAAPDEDDSWVNYFNRDTGYMPRTSSTNDWTMSDMIKAVEKYPAEIADILCTLGYRPDDLIEELAYTYDCDLSELI